MSPTFSRSGRRDITARSTTTGIPSQSSRRVVSDFLPGSGLTSRQVLSVRIFCDYYDKLRKPREGPPRRLARAELRQGDITWMSNQNYQVHQLRNCSVSGRVCCTLQCYQ